MSESNGIDKIYKIMELTRKVTDADIRETQEMIDGQLNYFSPLSRGRMAELHAIGAHNQRMLSKFVELKTAVDDFEEDAE